MKIAILIARAGPTNAPLFKKIAHNSFLESTVYYCTDIGVGKFDYDSEFNTQVNWGEGVLDGYPHIFLKNLLPQKISEKNDMWVNVGIITELLKNKYDAVLVYGWNVPTFWFAFLVCFFMRTPIFIWGENPLHQEIIKRGALKNIKRFILKNLFKIATGFLYIGNENKKFYEFFGVPPRKLFFAPYATNNELCIEKAHVFQSRKNELREQCGIDSKAPLILFVGKLIEKKRPLNLLKAYEKIVKGNVFTQIPTLAFVGDGALRSSLELYAKGAHLEKVHFAGFQTKDKVYQYMSMADVFVLPSGVGETWGMVVNEAMCFSLPVVVSDVVGCGSDLVRIGENGYITQLDNIDDLAGAILKIVSNQEVRERFGLRSFQIIQGYSQEKDIEGIIKAVSSIKHG
ncbi:MAG: glycosyltransferase family 4 protein [Candidatus Paceibacterota bacterium]|jgi:glycosyltransferase involved in cell wall biosynthesis